MTEDPESGWEDNNIFQSGAESSSPMRPSPVRTRIRKSSASGRPAPKSRKSMSAPPQVSTPIKDKGKERERSSSVKPPQSAFEPQLDLPSTVQVRRQLSIVPDLEEEEAPPLPSLADTIAEAGVEASADEEEEEDDHQLSEEFDDENVSAVAQRIADGGQLAKREPQTEPPRTYWLLNFLLTALLLSTSGFVYQYQQESAAIGFCDTDKSTNAILDGLRTRRAAIEGCNRENRTTLYLVDVEPTASVPPPIPTATPSTGQTSSSGTIVELCPPPPLIPYVQPDECTACPKHATCSPSSITCDNGYILRPHPLLVALPVPTVEKEGGLHAFERLSPRFPALDFAHILYGVVSYFDGMPYVGPVAAPPRCVEDPRRKRHIGALGKAIESILANERGRRLCEGVGVGLLEGDEATEAQRWGLEIEKLREHIKEKTPVSS